jgi:hypothetical protein
VDPGENVEHAGIDIVYAARPEITEKPVHLGECIGDVGACGEVLDDETFASMRVVETE